MVTAANTTLDLHLLQCFSLLVFLGLLLLLLSALEAHNWPEDDVLAERRSIRSWTGWLASLWTHLCPLPSLRDTRILLLLDYTSPNTLCALDSLAIFVDEYRYDLRKRGHPC